MPGGGAAQIGLRTTMQPPELILASTSPFRRQLLSRLGVEFSVASPKVDERPLEAEILGAGGGPREVAEALARAKSRAVATRHPAAVVIGSDQVCALGSDILGKPGEPDSAVAQLLRLQGQEHRLITAVCISHPGGEVRFTDVTRLQMRELGLEAIQRYVAHDDPIASAGAYKLEAQGIALFERIGSADHSAIIGLPLMALTRELVGLGYPIP